MGLGRDPAVPVLSIARAVEGGEVIQVMVAVNAVAAV